jgi:ATP-binding cassette subfamily A (ABC1) protein 3
MPPRRSLTQLRWLIWKNLKLKRRSLVLSVVEVLFPIMIVVVFSVIKSFVHNQNIPSLTFAPVRPPTLGEASPFLAGLAGQFFAWGPSGDPLAQQVIARIREAGDRGSGNGTGRLPPFLAFETEDDLRRHVEGNSTAEVWGAVWFPAGGLSALNATGTSNGTLRYTVRCPVNLLPDARKTVLTDPLSLIGQTSVDPDLPLDTSSPTEQYMRAGFLSVQQSVDLALLELALGPEEAPRVVPLPIRNATGSRLQRFPQPAFIVNTFAQAVQNIFSFLMIATFMISVRFLCSDVVLEKERRIREGLLIMGMRGWTNLAAWWITAAGTMGTTMLVVCIIFKVGKLFERADFSLLLIFYLLFMTATVSFAFCIAAFFSKARTAGIVSMLFFLMCNIPANFFSKGSPLDSSSGSAFAKTAACLLAPTAFSLGNGIIAQREVEGSGVTWSNLHKGDFTFATVLVMLCLDTAINIVLAWYLDKVVPGEFGAAHKPWFCFNPRYWFPAAPRSQAEVERTDLFSTTEMRRRNEEGGAVCEPEDPSLASRTSVRIRGLSKTFPNKDRGGPPLQALRGLSLDMYDGQVFCLLGPNGAGKTTTINILTGLLAPTGGDALVYGRSVADSIDQVREITGFCPQHDILFDRLTVKEHLMLVAGLKGVPADELDREVASKILEVGLVDKTDALSSDLSGGMKRRLSVAMAFVGGSKIVHLDEPNSGIDVLARRMIWSMIERNTAGRTIILTTHAMDEAERLGHKIAIVAKGRLRCSGGSLFLKAKFGVGYNLGLVRRENQPEAPLLEAVRAKVPAVKALTAHGMESTFLLPLTASPAFPELFDELDQRGPALGVQSYGISVTTLEEVFIKIAEEDDTAAAAAAAAAGGAPSIGTTPNTTSTDPSSLAAPLMEGGHGISGSRRRGWRQQLKAMLVKRALVSKRDKRGVLMQLVLPCAFILLGAVVIKSFPKTDLNKGQAITFTPQLYGAEMPFANGTGDYNASVTAAEAAHLRAEGYGLIPHGSPLELLASLGKEDATALGLKIGATAAWGNAANASGAFGPTGLYSGRAVHAGPMLLASLNAALMGALTGRNLSLEVTNDPLPRTPGNPAIDVLFLISSSILSFYVVMSLSFLGAVVTSNAVKERETKAKHQQLVSGVNRRMYWLSNYLCDLGLFVLPLVVAVAVFMGLNVTAFTGPALPAVVAVLVAFGLAVFPLAYSFSFAFQKHTTAQTVTLMFFLFGGLVCIIVSYVLYILGLQDNGKKYRDIGTLLKYPFFLLPNYAVGKALLDLSAQSMLDIQFKGFPSYKRPSSFSWRLCGGPIIFLLVEVAAYWALAFYLERRSTVSSRPSASAAPLLAQGESDPNHPKHPVDEDVLAEKQRVEARYTASGRQAVSSGAGSDPDLVSVVRLRKVYPASATAPPKVAVQSLSFGIHRGECFALLGPNGAGKSTALGVLTGELAPTAGTAWLSGHDILDSFEDICDELGFCPQADALLDLLTPREHLVLYARIKGVPEPMIPRCVDAMIHKVDLSSHADKLSKDLSGGNKRKLSLANALIGDPQILFVDEASTGVDPVSRRKLWDVIAEFQVGRAVVLTTHYLEEAEATSSRIGIMVAGELRAIGSPQHLKSRFGRGYLIEVNTHRPEQTEGVRALLEAALPGIRVIESHSSHSKYEVGQTGNSLGKMFRLIETNKNDLGIREFAVSQPTLEQIFINFARDQE